MGAERETVGETVREIERERDLLDKRHGPVCQEQALCSIDSNIVQYQGGMRLDDINSLIRRTLFQRHDIKRSRLCKIAGLVKTLFSSKAPTPTVKLADLPTLTGGVVMTPRR
jgi:hypothetical protein